MSAVDSASEYAAALRLWLLDNPPALERDGATTEQRLEFERSLYTSDLFGVWLPESVGGRGLPTEFRVAFERTLAAFGVQDRLARIGQNLLLPSLLEFGTPDQIERHAPGIISGQVLWCQGFSEPGAGSDLAGVRTRGQATSTGLVVTGQKIWTSGAHIADWCFAIVRTSDEPDNHQGLTFAFFPMSADGVDRRSIAQIDGNSEFSEVFLDSVAVASDDVLGGIGNGWRVAMSTLQAERSTANLGRQARFTNELGRLSRIVATLGEPGDALLDELGRHWVDSFVLRARAENLSQLDPTGSELGIAGSVAKLFWSEAHQASTTTALAVAENAYGVGAVTASELAGWRQLYLTARAETIYAGTSEVQRNIVARRGLGLPGRPSPVLDTLTNAEDAAAVAELAHSVLGAAERGDGELLGPVLESGITESLTDGSVEGLALFLESLAALGGSRSSDPVIDGLGTLWAGLSVVSGADGWSSQLSAGVAPAVSLRHPTAVLTADAGGVRLDGRATDVVIPSDATHAYLLARVGEHDLHLVRIPLQDARVTTPEIIGRPAYMADIDMDQLSLPADCDLGVVVVGGPAALRWELALCALQYGAMVSAFNQALTHASVREQFGSSIGAFQAVQHRLVNDYVAITSARLLLRDCLATLERGEDAEPRVDALKALLVETGARTVESAIQVHGGLGFTREATLDVLLHRVRLLSRWMSPAADCRRRLAERGLRDADAETGA